MSYALRNRVGGGRSAFTRNESIKLGEYEVDDVYRTQESKARTQDALIERLTEADIAFAKQFNGGDLLEIIRMMTPIITEYMVRINKVLGGTVQLILFGGSKVKPQQLGQMYQMQDSSLVSGISGKAPIVGFRFAGAKTGKFIPLNKSCFKPKRKSYAYIVSGAPRWVQFVEKYKTADTGVTTDAQGKKCINLLMYYNGLASAANAMVKVTSARYAANEAARQRKIPKTRVQNRLMALKKRLLKAGVPIPVDANAAYIAAYVKNNTAAVKQSLEQLRVAGLGKMQEGAKKSLANMALRTEASIKALDQADLGITEAFLAQTNKVKASLDKYDKEANVTNLAKLYEARGLAGYKKKTISARDYIMPPIGNTREQQRLLAQGVVNQEQLTQLERNQNVAAMRDALQQQQGEMQQEGQQQVATL